MPGGVLGAGAEEAVNLCVCARCGTKDGLAAGDSHVHFFQLGLCALKLLHWRLPKVLVQLWFAKRNDTKSFAVNPGTRDTDD